MNEQPLPTFSTEQIRSSAKWLALLAALLGWLFDGYEMGLFPVVARPALSSMLSHGGDGSVGGWMGIITATFLVGAALGGGIFGWLGDRIGRVRAMSFSILTYSLVTGLGYFAQEPWHLGVVRFIAALGMGGQWALGVALVMETWPEKWRPALAGMMGVASNLGFLLVGVVASVKSVTTTDWRWMMIVAAVPAVIVVFIVAFVPESARWKAAVQRKSENPLREVFAPALRGNTIAGILLASVALVGTWSSVQWLPLWADQIAGPGNPTAKANIHMLVAFGSIVGAFVAPLLGARLGRRSAYFLLCLSSLIVCGVTFRVIHDYGFMFLALAFAMGVTTGSFFGFFPLYLPELFPTRARATGQGICYNFGRIIAAAGAIGQGQLVAAFGGSYAKAGAVLTLVYAIGMVAVWWAPETKGKPLPE